MTGCFSSKYYEKCAPVPSLTCHKMRLKETASRDKSSTVNDLAGEKASIDWYRVWKFICVWYATGGFLVIFFYVLYSTLLHLPPLRFRSRRRMLGSNPGLWRLRHWLKSHYMHFKTMCLFKNFCLVLREWFEKAFTKLLSCTLGEYTNSNYISYLYFLL